MARNLLLGLMCLGKKMRGPKSGEKGVVPIIGEKRLPPVPAAHYMIDGSFILDSHQPWPLSPYRVLWRLTLGGERCLLSMATDRDVRQMQDWCKAVGRDIHKMHAFVRFRLVGGGCRHGSGAVRGVVRAGSSHRETCGAVF